MQRIQKTGLKSQDITWLLLIGVVVSAQLSNGCGAVERWLQSCQKMWSCGKSGPPPDVQWCWWCPEPQIIYRQGMFGTSPRVGIFTVELCIPMSHRILWGILDGSSEEMIPLKDHHVKTKKTLHPAHVGCAWDSFCKWPTINSSLGIMNC